MKLTAAIAALALSATAATASSFDLLVATGETTGSVAGAAFYDFGQLFVDDDAFEISIVATLAADGGFDTADASVNNLSYFTTDGLLEGELVEVAYGADTILALFETTTDDFAGAPWGDLVRATIDIPSVDWSGGVDLNDLFGFPDADITLDAVSVVPLPASLPLLAGGVALVAAAARRRR